MRLFVLIFFTFIILSGCGTVPEIHYYVIDYPISPKQVDNPMFDIVLGVTSFRSDPIYEEDRIIYRESPYEVKFYNYHQWMIPPKEMVTEKALSQLTASGLFSLVVPFPQYSQVDYLLRGTVKQFEERDKDKQWFAHVRLHLELINRDTGKLVWRNDFTQHTHVVSKRPIEVVRALGISLEACLRQATSELQQVLKSYIKD